MNHVRARAKVTQPSPRIFLLYCKNKQSYLGNVIVIQCHINQEPLLMFISKLYTIIPTTPQVRRPQPVLLARSQQVFDVDDRHGRLLPRPRRLRPRDRPHGTVHVGRQRQGQCSTTGFIGYSDIAGIPKKCHCKRLSLFPNTESAVSLDTYVRW